MNVFGLRLLLTLCLTLFSLASMAKTTTSYFLTIDSYDFESKKIEGQVCKYLAETDEAQGKCLPLNHGTYKLSLYDQEGSELNRGVDIKHKGQKWTYELDASGLDIDSVEIVLKDTKSKFKKHIHKTVKIRILKKITWLNNELRKLVRDFKRKKIKQSDFRLKEKKILKKIADYKNIIVKLDQKMAKTEEALASITIPLTEQAQVGLKLGFSYENYFFNYALAQGLTYTGSSPEIELSVQNRADSTKDDLCNEGKEYSYCLATVGPENTQINLTGVGIEQMAITRFMIHSIANTNNIIPTTVGRLIFSSLIPKALTIPLLQDDSAPVFSSAQDTIYTKEVNFTATATSAGSAINPASLKVLRDGVDITSFSSVILSDNHLSASVEITDPEASEGEHEYQVYLSNVLEKESEAFMQKVFLDKTAPAISASLNTLLNTKQIDLPVQISDASLERVIVSLNGVTVYEGADISLVSLNFTEGENSLEISATDFAGNVSSKTLVTTVDTIAPIITLSAPLENQKILSSGVTLMGLVSEASSLTINGTAVEVVNGAFSHTASASISYTLVAKDLAGNESTLVRNVIVNSVPTIALSTRSDYSIAPATFTFDFSNSHDDGVLTYKILDGQTELISSSNPIVTKSFETAFSKTLTAVVIDELGEKAQTTFSISLQANTTPSVNLSANVLEVYPNDPVNFVITSSDDEAVVSTEFNLGDGTLATLTTNSYTHAYSAIGRYTAQVTVTDRQGLSSSANVSINVVRKNVAPVASFSFDTAINNPPFNLAVDASSSTDDDGISSYKWRVNGGEWISVTTPLTELPIAQTGNNTIELMVTDSDNVDSEIVSKTYYANMPPVTNLTLDKTQGVAPVTVNIDASSSTDDQAVVSYKLETNNETIENTTGKFSYTYSTDGTFEVKVSAIDQFGASSYQSASVVVSRPEPVNHLLYAFFKVQANPDSAELQFMPFSTAPITKAWYEISDGRTIDLSEFLPETKSVLTFNSLDPVTVTLHVQTSDLTDTYSMVIDPSVVAENMPVNIDYAVIPGGSNSAVFYLPMIYHPDRSISDALQAQVDFGDGSSETVTIAEVPYLKHTYATSGSYTTKVSVYSNGELKGELSKVADVFSTLQEGMPLSIITGFKTYQLDMIGADYVTLSVDQSVSLVGDIIGYFWDLGDGTTATGKQAAHFYEKGSYQITLTVVDSLGNSQSVSKRIYVFDEGSDLVGAIQCVPTDLEFEVSCDVIVADKTAQLTTIHFSAGDGFETEIFPANSSYIYEQFKYTYAQAGTYEISATAHTLRGEDLTVNTEVILEAGNQAPVASFECMVDELSHTIMCDSSLSYDDGGITSYMWYVNDQWASSDALMMYEYPTGGDLNVKLVIGDDVLYTELVKSYFVNEINDYPIAKIQCYSDGLGVRCLSDGSYDPENGLLTYRWSSEGVELSTAQTLEYLFDSAGEKNITLEVTDDIGQSTTASTSVKISENPEDIINLALNCEALNLFIMFCTTENTTGTVDEYHWYVDGEDVTTGESYIEMKLSEGDHSVRVTAQNALFVEEKLTTYSIIYNDPIADFSYSLKEDGMVTFDASGSLGEGLSPYRFDWKVMDDTGYEYKSMTPYIEIDYEAVQGKEIQLTIYDLKDETATIQKLVNVSDYNYPPEPNFYGEGLRGQADKAVRFDASGSRDRDGSIVSYEWTIEGQVYYGDSIEHTFSDEGTFEISLKVIDDKGNSQDLQKEYVVEKIKIAGIESEYYPYSNMTFEVVNLSSFNETPLFKVDSSEYLVEEIGNKWLSVLLEEQNISRDATATLVIENRNVEVKYSVSNFKTISAPKEKIVTIVNELKERNDFIEIDDLNSNDYSQILDSFISVVESLDENSSNILYLYLNSQIKSLERENETVVNHFIIKSVFESIIPQAYALTDSEIVEKRHSCLYSLNGSAAINLAGNIVSDQIASRLQANMLSAQGRYSVVLEQFASGVASEAMVEAALAEQQLAQAIFVGRALSAPVATVVVGSVAIDKYVEDLRTCRSSVLFPHNVTASLEVDWSQIRNQKDGRYQFYQGVKEHINAFVDGTNYYGFKADGTDEDFNSKFYTRLQSFDSMNETLVGKINNAYSVFSQLRNGLTAIALGVDLVYVNLYFELSSIPLGNALSPQKLIDSMPKDKIYDRIEILNSKSLSYKVNGVETETTEDPLHLSIGFTGSMPRDTIILRSGMPINAIKFNYLGILDESLIKKIFNGDGRGVYTDVSDYNDIKSTKFRTVKLALLPDCSGQKTKIFQNGKGRVSEDIVIEFPQYITIDEFSMVCGDGKITATKDDSRVHSTKIQRSLLDGSIFILGGSLYNAVVTGDKSIDKSVNIVDSDIVVPISISDYSITNASLNDGSSLVVGNNAQINNIMLEKSIVHVGIFDGSSTPYSDNSNYEEDLKRNVKAIITNSNFSDSTFATIEFGDIVGSSFKKIMLNLQDSVSTFNKVTAENKSSQDTIFTAKSSAGINMVNSKYECYGEKRMAVDSSLHSIGCYLIADSALELIDIEDMDMRDVAIEGTVFINGKLEDLTTTQILRSSIHGNNISISKSQVVDADIVSNSTIKESKLEVFSTGDCIVSSIKRASAFSCKNYSQLKDSEKELANFVIDVEMSVKNSSLINAATVKGGIMTGLTHFPRDYQYYTNDSELNGGYHYQSKIENSNLKLSDVRNYNVTNSRDFTNLKVSCTVPSPLTDDICHVKNAHGVVVSLTNYSLDGGEYNFVTAFANTYESISSSIIENANITNCLISGSNIRNTNEKEISCAYIKNSLDIVDSVFTMNAEVEKGVIHNSRIEGKVNDSTILGTSVIYGSVENKSTVNNATVSSSGVVSDHSKVLTNATVDGIVSDYSTIQTNSTVANGTTVKNQATVQNYSKLEGHAVLINGTIDNTTLTGTAYISGISKIDKVCDGLNDTEPEDPCMK